MAFGKRNKKQSSNNTISVPQTNGVVHPFQSMMSSYSQTNSLDYGLYRSLREAIPIIDAAILKMVRLIGSFEVECENEAAQKQLKKFLENVRVGGMQRGISAFLTCFFDQMLTFGTAIGEIVVNGGQITHLYNSELKNINLSLGKSNLDVIISSDDGTGRFTPVKYPELILTSAHNPEPSSIYGTSILKGLPFVSDILLKIYNTIGVNWERVGNVRFAVTYKPQNDEFDRVYSQDRAKQMASEWSNTMNCTNQVSDFIAVGDVQIKTIGSDNPILDSSVPVRQMLEQIVAKLGIPPFLLGLSWSSTERMSSQQADILTSEIDAYRLELTPIINKICDIWLRLNGYSCDFEVKWNEVTLQDISEIAKSRYYDAQTFRIYNEEGDEDDEGKQNEL